MTIIKDVVDYSRTQMLANERQAIALFIAYMSYHLKHKKSTINAIITGSQSSGKTHCQKVIMAMLPPEKVFHTTSASPKSFIYDKEMKQKIYYFFSELQKLGDDWKEYLKSLSGDDMEFVYRVPTLTANGWRTRSYTCPKRPYSITYARGLRDAELKARLLRIPVDESNDLNEAIALWQFGVEVVKYHDVVYKQFVDEDEIKKILDPIRAKIEELQELNEAGDMPEVTVPPEFISILMKMVDKSKTDARRHSKLISSIIKTFAILDIENKDFNWLDPPKIIEADAQDLFNAIILHPLLISTITDLDDKAHIILDVIRQNQRLTTSEIHQALFRDKLSSMSRGTVYGICKALENMGLLETTYSELSKSKNWRVVRDYDIKNIDIEYNEIHKRDPTAVINPLTGVKHANFGRAIESLKEQEADAIKITPVDKSQTTLEAVLQKKEVKKDV